MRTGHERSGRGGLGACLLVLAVFLIVAAAGVDRAAAQSFDTSFARLAGDSGEPIEIEADELEVRDQDGVAVFTGNVTVRQSGAALKTQELTVHYVRNAAGGTAREAALDAGGAQEIARLEASGKVLVTAEDQAATGDRGFVDMQARTMEIAGNVTLTQGENVVTGDRLVVDLDDGRARVESRSRVRMLLSPGGGD